MMDIQYHHVSHFAQTWGMVLFVVIFVGVLVYALWPKNRAKFERAARAPLEED